MATRRGVLQTVFGAALAAAGRGVQGAKKQAGGVPPGEVPKGKYAIPAGARARMRELGRTGQRVSIVGLGGYHLGIPPEKEAIRMVQRALDQGMNFLDNCWDYNGGDSEARMGKALRDGYRQKAFLMTKLDGRTARSTREQLEQSLKRLRTDVIDLVQIHEVIRDDDPERCFAKGGTIEALLAARQAGKLRYIGFTGHKDPRIHRHMIETARKNGFHFDTVQMPVNVLDAHWHSFEKEIIPLALQESIAVLGMKPLAAGLIVEVGRGRSGGVPALRDERAGRLGDHHRLRQRGRAGAGAVARDHLHAHVRRREAEAAFAHGAVRPGRQVGTVQDHPDVRRHRTTQAMADLRPPVANSGTRYVIRPIPRLGPPTPARLERPTEPRLNGINELVRPDRSPGLLVPAPVIGDVQRRPRTEQA